MSSNYKDRYSRLMSRMQNGLGGRAGYSALDSNEQPLVQSPVDIGGRGETGTNPYRGECPAGASASHGRSGDPTWALNTPIHTHLRPSIPKSCSYGGYIIARFPRLSTVLAYILTSCTHGAFNLPQLGWLVWLHPGQSTAHTSHSFLTICPHYLNNLQLARTQTAGRPANSHKRPPRGTPTQPRYVSSP
jgi:hypothetical protein